LAQLVIFYKFLFHSQLTSLPSAMLSLIKKVIFLGSKSLAIYPENWSKPAGFLTKNSFSLLSPSKTCSVRSETEEELAMSFRTFLPNLG
jgi:hypothetical protein